MRDISVHTQPHLVPPMRPAFYNDMSAQEFSQHHNSISSWPQGHQDSERRAPRWGRKHRNESSTMPLKISAPSNFRVLQSSTYEEIHNFVDIKSTSSSRSTSTSRSTSPSPPPPPPSPTLELTPSIHYQPLDLRIHQSENRLSDLPSFKAFQLNEPTQHNTLAVPPRGPNYSAGMQKQAGSERLSSLGHPGRRSVAERDQVTSRLIPHFSTRIPVDLTQTAEVKSPVSSRPNSWLQRLSLSTLFSSKTKNRQSCERVPQTSSAPRSLHTASANSSPRNFNRSSFASSQTMPSQASLLPQTSGSLPDNRISDPSSPLSPSKRVSQWMFPSQISPMQVSGPKDNFKWEQRHSLGAASVPSTNTVTGARARHTVWSNGNPPRAVSSFFLSPTIEENMAASVNCPSISVNQQQGHLPARYQAYQTKRPHSSATGVGIAF